MITFHNGNSPFLSFLPLIDMRVEYMEAYVQLKVQNGDHSLSCGFHKERLRVFDASQRHVLSDSSLPGAQTLPLLQFAGEVFQFKASCFGLCTAPKVFSSVHAGFDMFTCGTSIFTAWMASRSQQIHCPVCWSTISVSFSYALT